MTVTNISKLNSGPIWCPTIYGDHHRNPVYRVLNFEMTHLAIFEDLCLQNSIMDDGLINLHSPSEHRKWLLSYLAEVNKSLNLSPH